MSQQYTILHFQVNDIAMFQYAVSFGKMFKSCYKSYSEK